MDVNTDEKRRSVLWNISRNVRSPVRGPNVIHPVTNGASPPRFLDRIDEIATSIVNPLLANPRRALVRSCCAIVLLLTTVSCVRQIIANAKIANAYAEIERVGGVQSPNHPSRIVFRDANMSTEDLQHLIPFLKIIPAGRDVDTSLPPCRALDFTFTRSITESEVSSLMKQLENTIVFYYTASGDGRCARTNDLQQRMALDRQLNCAP